MRWCPNCYSIDRLGNIVQFKCSPIGTNSLFAVACGCDCHHNGGRVAVHVNPFNGSERPLSEYDEQLRREGFEVSRTSWRSVVVK